MKYSRRTILIGGAALAVATYFALAYCLTATYQEEVPRRADLAVIYRMLPTATPGTYFAHMWLPNHVTRASVYESGLLLGEASAVYDDPGRTYSLDGKRWKYIEFKAPRAAADNPDLKRYWIIFR
jgi:hypothetical protein